MSNDGTSPDYLVGQVVWQARKDTGLTQSQLASSMSEITGTTLHKTAISKIEAGQRSMTFSEAAAVSFILGIPLSELAHPLRPADVFQKWDRSLDSLADFAKKTADLASECAQVSDDLADVHEFLDDEHDKHGPLAEDRDRLLSLIPEMEHALMEASSTFYGVSEQFSRLRRHGSA